ncbi:hypothetical protein [uncultured Winogradskyella sp.]|uniref:hypothetical protein n=1 Tax=uncultured Winogradskyella sp. TaxID=395353 RepID=UPI00262D2F82|nr:hypothetical protein [uncultured Winogradskyella sp.]
MQEIEAHSITTTVLMGSSIFVPFIAFGTYKASGASTQKSIAISAVIAVWGVLMYYFSVVWQFRLGNPDWAWVIVIVNLIIPTALVFIFKNFFIGDGLSLKWLTITQSTRFMGTLFILENIRGFTGTTFAYVSGFGDFMAAVIALTILVLIFTGGKPTKGLYMFLIVFGLLDFVVAYGLSISSSPGVSLQSIAIGENHSMNMYPLALLPYFLVPFATAYHFMMYLTIKRNPELK